MQWTTRKYYRTSTIHSIISVLSCVLLLAISPPAVANDLTNDVSFIRAQLETLLADLNSGVSTLSGDIVGVDNTLNNYLVPLLPLVQGQGNTLSSVLSALNGSSSSSIANRLQDLQYMINGAGGLYQYENIFGYLNEIAQNTANSGSTNIYNVKVDARDILAGNPWWSTNSAFTLTTYGYNSVFPDDGANSSVLYSFPQFMSKWSGMLTYPQGQSGITQAQFQRGDWVNFFGWQRINSTLHNRPYSWFDWMADATRSNLVLQSSAMESASTDADYIVNHLDLLLDALSSSESVAYSNYVASSSNLVLVSENFTSNEVVSIVEDDSGVFEDDDFPTNTLAPLSLHLGTISGDPFTVLTERLQDYIPTLREGDPIITVIPSMTIGGINVPEGMGHIFGGGNTRSVPSSRQFLEFWIPPFFRWFWRFSALVGIFYLVRVEWNFWSTLGGSASD